MHRRRFYAPDRFPASRLAKRSDHNKAKPANEVEDVKNGAQYRT
ncbi:MAG: hypothetical protein QGF56_10370 [Verrucomicrobiota bacterium]|nr:hypothetical protein [Verrucomicrobiota bacterium]